MRVLALKSRHKGSNTPSLESPVENEQRMRHMNDFLWFQSVLSVSFSAFSAFSLVPLIPQKFSSGMTGENQGEQANPGLPAECLLKQWQLIR